MVLGGSEGRGRDAASGQGEGGYLQPGAEEREHCYWADHHRQQ